MYRAGVLFPAIIVAVISSCTASVRAAEDVTQSQEMSPPDLIFPTDPSQPILKSQPDQTARYRLKQNCIDVFDEMVLPHIREKLGYDVIANKDDAEILRSESLWRYENQCRIVVRPKNRPAEYFIEGVFYGSQWFYNVRRDASGSGKFVVEMADPRSLHAMDNRKNLQQDQLPDPQDGRLPDRYKGGLALQIDEVSKAKLKQNCIDVFDEMVQSHIKEKLGADAVANSSAAESLMYGDWHYRNVCKVAVSTTSRPNEYMEDGHFYGCKLFYSVKREVTGSGRFVVEMLQTQGSVLKLGFEEHIDLTACDSATEPTASPPVAAPPSWNSPGAWNLNGSTLTMRLDGSRLTVVYKRPRSGLLEMGVSPGTPLFEGTLQNDSYVGSISTFAKSCPMFRTEATATFSNDLTTVTISYQSPTVNANCVATRNTPTIATLNRFMTNQDWVWNNPK